MPKIGRGTTWDTEKFIIRAKEKYGDKYTYEKVDYKNTRSKVCITCPKHGDFYKTPVSFLTNHVECTECSKTDKIRVVDIETFRKKASIIHNNYYDYSKSVFVSTRANILIICPEHGEFWQKTSNHLLGRGCPQCSHITTEEWIEKAKEIHGDLYDYSQVVYTKAMEKVTIGCKNCGKTFEQLANNHLQGRGCQYCCENKKVSVEEWKERCRQNHFINYDYSLIEFEVLNDFVTIICPVHGEVQQRASIHLYGANCPKCNQSKGEIAIKAYLEQLNRTYEEQKIFHIGETARSTDKVVVDFYLEVEDKRYIVEFHGKQHYIYSDFHYKCEDDFIRQQNRDASLRRFCNANNITLIEICYKDELQIKNIIYKHFGDNIR